MTTFEIWTLAIAVYAAVVSTVLMILQIVGFRRASGVVKVSTSYHPGTDDMVAVVSLHVTNSGSGSVTVNKLEFNGPGPVTIPLPFGEMIVQGPQIPARIEPRTSATWLVDANNLKTMLRENGWTYEVRGIVTLATGKQVWESIHQYTTVH